MANLKLFPEKKYKKIIQNIGSLSYRIFNQNEKDPGDIFSRVSNLTSYNSVLAGTGATIADYSFQIAHQNLHSYQKIENIIVPKASEVVVARFLRYDDSHGRPHYNAHDHIIFPNKKGNIFSLTRSKPPDHYILLSQNSNIRSIADAYKLPREKCGSISSYNEYGASLHVELFPRNTKKR